MQKLDFSDSFTVYVGACVVHKALFAQTSDFFAKATSNSWNEADRKKEVSLQEVAPRMFEYYVQWQYTWNVVASEHLELMQLYLLGQFLIDGAFKSAVVDRTIEIITKASVQPEMAPVKLIYSNTLEEDCGMKRLLTRFWYFYSKADGIKQCFDELPGDFSSRLLQEFVAVRDGTQGSPSLQNRCYFHDHDRTAPKLSTCKDDPLSNSKTNFPPKPTVSVLPQSARATSSLSNSVASDANLDVWRALSTFSGRPTTTAVRVPMVASGPGGSFSFGGHRPSPARPQTDPQTDPSSRDGQ
ncbi:uncharacterized protein LTR77_011097 [Saxophila tyrrhenica]|uniref:BTB domain-containing protein n=1 Tax=Saxophila tyrrhenica TaxID=1690608 RepID=A0AAV9NTX0_9PEZI|nr:hypothetical protein LTR77_011097 [Saxophila tyrrhenica]